MLLSKLKSKSYSHKDNISSVFFKQFWDWRMQICTPFCICFWLQSFTITDRFISAQFPLPDYTEDFLRLVEAYYTPTIVSLCPLMEVESVNNSTIYTKWKIFHTVRNFQNVLSLLTYYSRYTEDKVKWKLVKYLIFSLSDFSLASNKAWKQNSGVIYHSHIWEIKD